MWRATRIRHDYRFCLICQIWRIHPVECPSEVFGLARLNPTSNTFFEFFSHKTLHSTFSHFCSDPSLTYNSNVNNQRNLPFFTIVFMASCNPLRVLPHHTWSTSFFSFFPMLKILWNGVLYASCCMFLLCCMWYFLNKSMEHLHFALILSAFIIFHKQMPI